MVVTFNCDRLHSVVAHESVNRLAYSYYHTHKANSHKVLQNGHRFLFFMSSEVAKIFFESSDILKYMYSIYTKIFYYLLLPRVKMLPGQLDYLRNSMCKFPTFSETDISQ